DLVYTLAVCSVGTMAHGFVGLIFRGLSGLHVGDDRMEEGFGIIAQFCRIRRIARPDAGGEPLPLREDPGSVFPDETWKTHHVALPVIGFWSDAFVGGMVRSSYHLSCHRVLYR